MSGIIEHQGAPGTAEAAERSQHESLESIKNDIAGREGTANSGSDSLVAGGSSGVLNEAKPPVSNPGSDDPTGGIAHGSGGKSSAAHIGSPLSVDESSASNPTITSQVTGLVSSFATALGFGGKESVEGHSEPGAGGISSSTTNTTTDYSDKTVTQTAQDYAVAGGAAVTTTAATAAAYVTGKKQGDPATSSYDQTPITSNQDDYNTMSSSSPSNTNQTTSVNDSSTAKMSETENTVPSNPSTDDSVPSRDVGAEGGSSDNAKGLQPTGKPPAAGTEGGKRGAMENPDAIPTAGGERLGKQHWGESKTVPDLPPAQDQSGVASTDGQPTQQVQDNTAANTGGATGGPGAVPGPTGETGATGATGASTDSKPGVMDKVKGALHVG